MYYVFSKRVQKISFSKNVQKFFWIFSVFSVFVPYSLVFLGLIPKILKFGMKIKDYKKKSEFFLEFFTEHVVHLGIFSISGIPKISVVPFNTIEYWKWSIPKFQYYWIQKMVNTEFSILLNTKKTRSKVLRS